MTDKDLEDLYLAIDLGVEWIAQSFVRSPYDVEELKRRISSKLFSYKNSYYYSFSCEIKRSCEVKPI